MSEIKSKQNFPLAVISGFIASIIAASLWAVATFVTGFQLVFMPIVIGFIVGYCVRLLGKGTTFPFGLIGAIFTLLSCFLGHFLTMIAAAASIRNTSFFTIVFAVLGSKIDEEFFIESFSVVELLFYVIAICIGFILSIYRFSSKKNLQPIKL